MRRIVVAIDPAISIGEDSDETGIIVAGLGSDAHGYVLADESGKYAPTEWARRAVALYRKWNADRIVAEANQGGDMVQTTVRMVDANVSFKAVHASRSKITRAEPVSALSEQGRLHLVGSFPELEDQLCTYEAGSSDSPDRLDAMVWAISELMVNSVQPEIKIVAPILIGASDVGGERRAVLPGEFEIHRRQRRGSLCSRSRSSGFTIRRNF